MKEGILIVFLLFFIPLLQNVWEKFVGVETGRYLCHCEVARTFTCSSSFHKVCILLVCKPFFIST